MSIGGLVGAVAGGVIGFFIGGPVGALYGASIGFALGMAIDPMTPDMPSAGAPDQMTQVMSSTVGDPVPDLAGTAKITGHLLCYGKERAEPVYSTSSGGGGKGGGPPEPQPQITGYKYYMSWVLGIVAGPVDILYAIYKGEDVVWEGELNCPASGGKETIVLSGVGSVDFYFGTADQVANSKVGEIISDATLNTPYRNMCWAFFDDCYIGEYNRTPTMKFIIKKIPENAFSTKHEIQTYDCNPAHAMWYILHNLAGLPESWLHSADFAAVASTLWGESRGISVLFDRQQSALNYLESINNHIDNIIRYDTDGKFHPKLIRDDYTVGDLPLIDEDVMLEEPTFNRKSWIDTLNEMKVQYSEIIDVERCKGCEDAEIEYTTQQMKVNEEQSLSINNFSPACKYDWEITSGGGNLSPTTGDSVIYTAPSSNENCDQNPVISLSIDEDVCDTLVIAINAYEADVDAYKINWECMCEDCFEVGEVVCGYECGTSWCFSCGHNYYNCDGILRRTVMAHAGGDSPYELCLGWYETFCGGKTQSTEDLRSPTAKIGGCCPMELL